MSKNYQFIIIMHNSDVKNIAFKNIMQPIKKYTRKTNNA